MYINPFMIALDQIKSRSNQKCVCTSLKYMHLHYNVIQSDTVTRLKIRLKRNDGKLVTRNVLQK